MGAEKDTNVEKRPCWPSRVLLAAAVVVAVVAIVVTALMS